jgi:hypothetical protein
MGPEELSIVIVCATIGAILIILFGILLYRRMKSDKNKSSKVDNKVNKHKKMKKNPRKSSQ